MIVGVDPQAAAAAPAALGARLAAGAGCALELFTPVYNSHISLAHFENREHLQHARDALVRRYLERLEEIGAALGFGGTVHAFHAWEQRLRAVIGEREAATAPLLGVPGI